MKVIELEQHHNELKRDPRCDGNGSLGSARLPVSGDALEGTSPIPSPRSDSIKRDATGTRIIVVTVVHVVRAQASDHGRGYFGPL